MCFQLLLAVVFGKPTENKAFRPFVENLHEKQAISHDELMNDDPPAGDDKNVEKTDGKQEDPFFGGYPPIGGYPPYGPPFLEPYPPPFLEPYPPPFIEPYPPPFYPPPPPFYPPPYPYPPPFPYRNRRSPTNNRKPIKFLY